MPTVLLPEASAAPRCYPAGKLSAPYIVLNDVNITSGAYSYQRYGQKNMGIQSNHTHVYGYGNKRKQDEHNDKMTPFYVDADRAQGSR